MTTIAEIVAALDATEDPEQEWAKLASLASEIEGHPEGVRALPAVFALYERYPDSDFGIPGPLAHAIERYYGQEYMHLLLESLRRRPTEQTLFLAERVLNVRDEFHPMVLSAVRSIAASPMVEALLRDEASRIAERQT